MEVDEVVEMEEDEGHKAGHPRVFAAQTWSARKGRVVIG